MTISRLCVSFMKTVAEGERGERKYWVRTNATQCYKRGEIFVGGTVWFAVSSIHTCLDVGHHWLM